MSDADHHHDHVDHHHDDPADDHHEHDTRPHYHLQPLYHGQLDDDDDDGSRIIFYGPGHECSDDNCARVDFVYLYTRDEHRAANDPARHVHLNPDPRVSAAIIAFYDDIGPVDLHGSGDRSADDEHRELPAPQDG